MYMAPFNNRASCVHRPLGASVESIMAERAQVSMTGFLDYCSTLIERLGPPDDRAAVEGGGKVSAAAADGGAASTAVGGQSDGQPPVLLRSSGGGLGTRRSFRWPSVAVSSFVATPPQVCANKLQHR